MRSERENGTWMREDNTYAHMIHALDRGMYSAVPPVPICTQTAGRSRCPSSQLANGQLILLNFTPFN